MRRPVADVDGWFCLSCGRLFGRTRQAHDCEPGLTLKEYFATGPPHERAVFDTRDHSRACVVGGLPDRVIAPAVRRCRQTMYGSAPSGSMS